MLPEKELKKWLLQQKPFTDQEITSLESIWIPLKGDAGFRQYFRVKTTPSLIAVYAPISTENSSIFIHIADYLRAGSVVTPRVIASDLNRGFLLVEDLGEDTYFDHLNSKSADRLYSRALYTLLDIQSIPNKKELFGNYDQGQLLKEMNLFPEWFVSRLLSYELNSIESQLIQRSMEFLIKEILTQPNVIVHRDFHSQNILYGKEEQPGIIDFQDALWGPITYDLVSLLRDCYIQWDSHLVERWVLFYLNELKKKGICADVSEAQFIRWFDLTGIQRHMKVLGIFARLSLRDCKHKYLNDLPLVIAYFRTVMQKYEEFSQFLQWFDNHLVPLIENQPWAKKAQVNFS